MSHTTMLSIPNVHLSQCLHYNCCEELHLVGGKLVLTFTVCIWTTSAVSMATTKNRGGCSWFAGNREYAVNYTIDNT